jgi:hypothetical protein
MLKRIALSISLLLLSFSICSFANQAQDQKASENGRFVGTWAGKWEGGGSGGNIELSLSTESDKLVGKVSVTTDNGEFNTAIKTLSFDGNKMTAIYDNPGMDGVEVTLISTFDGNSTKGTWSMHQKGQTAEMFSGTWTATKK